MTPVNSNSANPTPSQELETYLERLFARIDYERNVPDSVKNFDLSKMLKLVQCLGNPHLQYPVIHVAGTKGKGSVCVMAAAMLTASGLKTGVYTSPHMETIHQRMAIDGALITDSQLRACFEHVTPLIEAFDQEQIVNGDAPVSFFEYTTALALTFFAREKCQVVVLETGLGGRLDSTNVCQPELCIITNISLDHTRLLGNTIAQIAGEKAGIIKQGIPVISGATDPESRTVIQSVAQTRQSHLLERESNFTTTRCAQSGQFSFRFGAEEEIESLQLKMPGQHQRENASLAIAAMVLLRKKGWKIEDADIRAGLKTAMLPGRIEIVGNQPTVLMDMAHNPASVAALVQLMECELSAWKTASEKVLIFGTTRDKDSQRMLELLLPIFDRIIFTQYKNNPRGLKPEKLTALSATILENQPTQPKTEIVADPIEAWQAALTPTGDRFICIAGSAFLIAELRPEVLAFTQRD